MMSVMVMPVVGMPHRRRWPGGRKNRSQREEYGQYFRTPGFHGFLPTDRQLYNTGSRRKIGEFDGKFLFGKHVGFRLPSIRCLSLVTRGARL
jgi:hypothetical protein